ncbi:MAG TPA: metallophosphoesterase [Thermomicrobiales bacterium]|nr:metallophosphoesterase [Thermomicrobiales bacterium]
MATHDRTVRLAAISDLHYGKGSQGSLQSVFSEISDTADILVICGDLTDYGLPEEALILAKDLNANVKIPIVAVLGNHDYESGRHLEICDILTGAGVTILDGDSVELRGIGFAGVKGFAGGFGRGALGYWGEPAIKAFVQEALDEALKLETALARLRSEQRIAILHYAPIRGTVEGEPPVIYPFLGCSRLEDPINRYPVMAVFHGHAHNGTHEGHTTSGIPVYNVSHGLLKKIQPSGSGFHVMEIAVTPAADTVPVM